MNRRKYRLRSRVETGALADLYRATDDSARRVGVKLFHPHTSDGRYAREIAGTARALSGAAGIVPVLEVGMVQGRLAVVREEVEGPHLGYVLGRLTARDFSMAPSVALFLLIELLEIADRAHQAGVLHGALTPANVLVSRDGVPAICDFGALRALDAATALRQIFEGRGRDCYRAPELARAGEVGRQADVFSLGALAYELLTLRELAPQTGVTRPAPPIAPSRIDRRLSSRLDPVLLRAIDPSPGRRFPTCAAFAQALRDWLMVAGGLPPRDELKRFIAELIPSWDALTGETSLALEGPWVLEEVTGTEEAPGVEVSGTVPLRTPFSHPFEPGAQPALPVERSPSRGGELSASSPVLKRVRVIEDFEHLTLPEADLTQETQVPRPPRSSSRPRQEPTDESSGYAAIPAEDVGPVSDPEFPHVHTGRTGAMRPMVSGERRLYKAAKSRRRAINFVLAAAVAGLFVFAYVVVKAPAIPAARLPAPPVTAPVHTARPAPVAPLLPVFTPVSPPAPVEAKPTATPRVEWHQPAPKKTAALVSVRANVPVRIFIDGARVKRPAPLKDYPVAPGLRQLTVVDVKTGERREFSLKLTRGKARHVEEQFGKHPERVR